MEMLLTVLTSELYRTTAVGAGSQGTFFKLGNIFKLSNKDHKTVCTRSKMRMPLNLTERLFLTKK
jgi:hypothetical protein